MHIVLSVPYFNDLQVIRWFQIMNKKKINNNPRFKQLFLLNNNNYLLTSFLIQYE